MLSLQNNNKLNWITLKDNYDTDDKSAIETKRAEVKAKYPKS